MQSVTGVWSAAGEIAGRLARWQPPLWCSPGGERVLVIAPHPDDEVGCGGTLLLHGLAGDAVHVAYVTDGRGSRAGGLGPDQMAARRRQEVAAVAPVLGLAGVHWLGLREREWDESALVPALRDLLRQTAPDILYAPSCVDFHPEHVRVARCLAQASAGLHELRIRVYQIQVPLTPVLVNLVTPIESVASELLRAMRYYATQFGSIERCFRMKRYGGSLYRVGGPAEELWQMDADAYGRVHAEDAGGDGAFRGLRALPFTDPLSYARGLRARVRLRALSRAG